MSRAIYKMKKYGQSEVKNLEATIRGAGQEHLHYLFGEDLIEYEGDSYFLDVAEKRIKSLNLNRVVRKDAVYLVDTMITASKDFFEGLDEEEIKQFFNKCFVALSEFFNNGKSKLRSTYPNENVVSAVVILGENPCLHFSFVPVTTEGKLSAKKIVSTKMLFSLRKYLFETVWADCGLSDTVKNELENSEEENLFLKFDLDQIRPAKDTIRNANTVETEEKGELIATPEDSKNAGAKPLGRLDAEFKRILVENNILREENLGLRVQLTDLQDDNRNLKTKIDNLEMKKSATDLGQDNLEMKTKIAQFDPKSWTVIMMQELTMLRLGFDYLLRTYVGGMAGIDSLPDSEGKEKLKNIRKHYEMRGGKS